MKRGSNSPAMSFSAESSDQGNSTWMTSNMPFLYMKKLFDNNPGCIINFNLTLNSSIERINIQTQAMTKVFQSHPETLLLIRSHNAVGKVLYTFVTDGQDVNSELSAFSRIVHVAFPVDESPEKLAEMFHFLKEFNPCWSQIRFFLVDPFFKGKNALAKAFPSAEIVLSAFHICTYYKQNIYKLSLPQKVEELLVHSLNCTMCSASQENLQKMYVNFQQYIQPDLLLKFKHDWLLCDRIWALHRWRNGQESYAYFELICTLREKINQIFSKSLCLGEILFTLISFIQNQRENKQMPRMMLYSPQVLPISAKEQAPISMKTLETNACPLKSVDSPGALLLNQSLVDICIPAAADLCMKEFEVVQRSTQVISNKENKVNVLLCEEQEVVDNGSQMTCSCPFYRTVKLPCRHILSFLKANHELLKPELLDTAWQKQSNAGESTLPVSAETLKILKRDTSESAPTKEQADTLTEEITKLLTECSDDVFQHRYQTFRDLADAWIGPYEQVKL
uniref:Zinc finger SWIM-type containing 1 n=1 Tax=Leptobrachium leishanense TaxID=445787 RepID=A0A8C5R993_9ANUR